MDTAVTQIEGVTTMVTDILLPETLSKTEAHSTDTLMKILGQGTLEGSRISIGIKGIGKMTENILGLSLTQNLAEEAGLSITGKRNQEVSKLPST